MSSGHVWTARDREAPDGEPVRIVRLEVSGDLRSDYTDSAVTSTLPPPGQANSAAAQRQQGTASAGSRRARTASPTITTRAMGPRREPARSSPGFGARGGVRRAEPLRLPVHLLGVRALPLGTRTAAPAGQSRLSVQRLRGRPGAAGTRRGRGRTPRHTRSRTLLTA